MSWDSTTCRDLPVQTTADFNPFLESDSDASCAPLSVTVVPNLLVSILFNQNTHRVLSSPEGQLETQHRKRWRFAKLRHMHQEPVMEEDNSTCELLFLPPPRRETTPTITLNYETLWWKSSTTLNQVRPVTDDRPISWWQPSIGLGIRQPTLGGIVQRWLTSITA